MKIRNRFKEIWMLLLIIAISIVGTTGSVFASDSKNGTSVDMMDPIANLSTASVEIKANGLDGPIFVSSITPVSVTIGLEAGIQFGAFSDWWFVVSTPNGLVSWVYPTGWTTGLVTAIQLPLFGFSGLEMFNGSLPAGVYVFYFGVDTTPDDVLNSPIIYDSVEINVVE